MGIGAAGPVGAQATGPQGPGTDDITELSLEQLLAVTVTGASKYEQRQDQVAAAVSVITRDEIKAFGWRTLDEALASLPGIHTTYDRQYSYLGMRGFGLPADFNTRLLITINGNRINDVVYDAATAGLDFNLELDLIERIEFIPGPGGAVYGQNALFGVVNVVTRNGMAVDGVEVSAAYHSLQQAGEGRVTWGRRLKNGLDLLLSASGYDARGQDHFYDFGDAGVSGVAEGMDGKEYKRFFASAARGPWSVDFSSADHRKDDPTGIYFSDPLVPGQYERDRRLMTQLQYQEGFAGETLQLTGRVFLGQERYTGLFSYGTPFLATGSSDWQGFEVRLLATGLTGHKLLVGAEYQNNARQDQGNEDLLDPANGVFIPRSGWRAGAYVQDEWTLGGKVSATLGLRIDGNNVTNNGLSPRAGLIWRVTPDTSVKALYGRAHRAPNAFERDYEDSFSQVANLALGGETIDTLEWVVDHRVAPDFNLRGSLYQWRMRDLITLGMDPVSGLSQYQSGSAVTATGLELSADKTWTWGGLMRGSLSYQDVTGRGGELLPNSPRWLGKLNLSSPLVVQGMRLGYELQHVARRQAIKGPALDGYWLSNLHLSAARWSKGLEVSLGLYNLFDTRYEHPGSDINWQDALEQDGRSIQVRLRFRF
jgi:iron complex outermembrane receptor protein